MSCPSVITCCSFNDLPFVSSSSGADALHVGRQQAYLHALRRGCLGCAVVEGVPLQGSKSGSDTLTRKLTFV